MANMNITTRTTIENLTKQIKATFAKKAELTPIQTAANAAFKSIDVSGGKVSFYTSTDHSGTAAASFDFPEEFFLDQAKTGFVQSFAWSETTYPGSTDPELEGKPVMVLAVKGDGSSPTTYSFVDLAALTDTGKADKVTGATANNIAKLDANGNLADSGIAAASVVNSSDINDYTEQEIAALLADDPQA